MAPDKKGEKYRAVANLRAVQKSRLYEEIVQQIQTLIEEGRLKYGDQLPPERDLAGIFQVSRHSVREAIRILEEKQVLRSRPGSGTYVILEDEPSVVDFLAKAIHQEKDKLLELFQFRRMIEPQIARLAAENATQEEIGELERILKLQEEEIEDTDASIELDVEFHLALARGTKNAVVAHIIEMINGIISQSRSRFSQSPLRRRLSIQGHARVVSAIRRGEPDLARSAMDEHLASIEEVVV